MSDSAQVPGRGFLWCLGALLVWAPLPLGSNRPWAVGLLAMALWALLMVVLVMHLRTSTGKLARRLRMAQVPLLLWLGLAALVTLQLVLPDGTSDPARTREYLLRTLIYGAAFALTIAVANAPERLRALLVAVVCAGLFQAALAIVLHASGAQYQFLFTEFDQGSRAMGTFPNPDHLAGYMEICLSAGLGLLFAQFGGEPDESPPSWQRTLRTALDFLMSWTMLLRLALVLLVIALVMTHSRMGNGAFFLSLLLVGCLVAAISRRLRRPALWLVLSMVVIDVIIIGQWVGLDRVVTRLQGTVEASIAKSEDSFALGEAVQEPSEESIMQRLTNPAQALQAVAQKPWLGHGGGSFYTVFPPFKAPDFPMQWNHAHNDYVEVASDTGLLGLALWVGLGVVTLARALSLLRDSQPRLSRGVGAATLMVLCTIGLHSIVDFNLQIPANAMTLSVILGLAWSVPLRRAAHSGKPRRKSFDTTIHSVHTAARSS